MFLVSRIEHTIHLLLCYFDDDFDTFGFSLYSELNRKGCVTHHFGKPKDSLLALFLFFCHSCNFLSYRKIKTFFVTP